MTNSEFLLAIKQSFTKFLEVKTSRSTAKLKDLHGKIAADLKARLGDDFTIKAQGFGNDKEGKISGRYYDKNVDIFIEKNGICVGGIGVKFVMQNYLQNSNNYFENMLGETANIRTASALYFQIFIIFDRVPYYDKDKKIKKYDEISAHNIKKYTRLSQDDTARFFHTPNKMLFVLLTLKSPKNQLKTKDEYINFYTKILDDTDLINYAKIKDEFGNGVILNDYENFATRLCSLISGHLK